MNGSMMDDLQAKARAVLAANDRGGYTVPTHGLYPFQWNWDSAFVAMGIATYDIDRALRELERLVEGQWDDGMIPQIVFHAPSDSYFPGPDVWGTAHRIPTSGITQPPVFAIALERIAARVGATFDDRLRKLYRAALASHRWFAAARDPEATGLVATLHNWETGRDNSPEWDAPFSRVPETTTIEIRRRDTSHVDAAMRPRDSDYRRYIHLVDAYRGAKWDAKAMWRVAPFKVADVGTNAILLAAEESLRRLAERHGEPGDAATIEERIARMRRAQPRLWSERLGRYASRDLIADAPIEVAVSAGFLPLLTSAPDEARKARLLSEVEASLRDVRLSIPSTAPTEPAFESKRYWRGPVWAVVNWMIAEGLDRHGAERLARDLRRQTIEAIRDAGLAEYFDPLTREGLGGGAFSWTAAILLLMLERE